METISPFPSISNSRKDVFVTSQFLISVYRKWLEMRNRSEPILHFHTSFLLLLQLKCCTVITLNQSIDYPSMGKKKGDNSKLDESQEKRKRNPAVDNVKWDMEQDKFLLDFLLKEKKKGNTSDNSFKAPLFARIASKLEEKFPGAAGGKKTGEKVQGRWQKVCTHIFFFFTNISQLKSQYKIVNTLQQQSGFGWDEEKKMVTADKDVWNWYLESHPEAKPFRDKPFPLYDELNKLCHSVIATGNAAFNAGQRH
jgi:hypothetical protein